MKRLLFAIFAGCITISATCIAHEKCHQWKQVCHQKKYCVSQEQTNKGCYHCVKAGRYGFHVFPRGLERNTCNRESAHYLVNMGYSCYPLDKSSSCERFIQKEFCKRQCIRY